MSKLTTLGDLPYPVASDAADLPYHLQSLAEAVDGRTVLRYSNAAARDAKVTKPVAGMLVWLGTPNQLQYYTGAVWVPVAPPPVFGVNATVTTTASATYVEATGEAVTFTAPASGTVLVTVGAYMYSSVTTTASYMSAAVKQGTTVVLDSSDDRAATVYGGARASASTTFRVTGLTAGGTYTAIPSYKSGATSNTATYDNRFIRVDAA